MRKHSPILAIALAIVLLSSCKSDDSPSCTTCNNPQTVSFELCRDSNGNATVNGEDTGTDYDLYRDGLAETGVTCGG